MSTTNMFPTFFTYNCLCSYHTFGVREYLINNFIIFFCVPDKFTKNDNNLWCDFVFFFCRSLVRHWVSVGRHSWLVFYFTFMACFRFWLPTVTNWNNSNKLNNSYQQNKKIILIFCRFFCMFTQLKCFFFFCLEMKRKGERIPSFTWYFSILLAYSPNWSLQLFS